MRYKSFFRIIFVLLILIFSFISVTAQEIDISTLSEEQRTILLISLLQQMQQENADLVPTPIPSPTPTPLPTEIRLEDYNSDQLNALLFSLLSQMQLENGVKMPDEGLYYLELTQTPQPSAEAKTFQIYQNKKLIIEGLPGYMFIQPTRESAPGGDSGGEDDVSDNCPSGCVYDCAPIAFLEGEIYCGCICE